jgi:tetratricopeptide (TPR) repeat protein
MQKPIKYCFPFRLESIQVYETALDYNQEDSRACYYLGNLLYDKQPELAIQWWSKAVEFEPGLAMAQRNLGWGYQQTFEDTERAVDFYRTAINYDPTQPRFYSELDKLFEVQGEPIETRVKLLTANHQYVSKLQSALMREILVLVIAGDYDRAIELMDGRIFYRQEDVNILHDLHVDAHLLKGRQLLAAGDVEAALKEFLLADTYPENQMIERARNYDRNPRIYYYTGLAYEKEGDRKSAQEYYTRALSQGNTDNEYLYYQAMAYLKTGDKEQARKIFQQMVTLGEDQLEGSSEIDFFAKFGRGLTEGQRKAMSYQIIALGYLGQDEKKKAKEFFTKSLQSDVDQIWSKAYLAEL